MCSVWIVTTAAVTHLRSVCTQQVRQFSFSVYDYCMSLTWSIISVVLYVLLFSSWSRFSCCWWWWSHVACTFSLPGLDLVWLKILLVLCSLLLLPFLFFLYKCHKFKRKKNSEFTLPESIQVSIFHSVSRSRKSPCLSPSMKENLMYLCKWGVSRLHSQTCTSQSMTKTNYHFIV